METWLAVLSIFLGYILGSIPSAYILVRLTRKTDIRTLGTGNVGALNAYQQMGPVAGIAILIADVSKGVVAVFFAPMDRCAGLGTLWQCYRGRHRSHVARLS